MQEILTDLFYDLSSLLRMSFLMLSKDLYQIFNRTMCSQARIKEACNCSSVIFCSRSSDPMREVSHSSCVISQRKDSREETVSTL
jgi:hypothetical protein